MSNRSLVGAVCLLSLASISSAQGTVGSCSESDQEYERLGFTVRRVSFESPFLGARSLETYARPAELGLQAGSPFTATANTVAQQRLRDALMQRSQTPGEAPRLSLQAWIGSSPPRDFNGGQVVIGSSLAVAFIRAAIVNCDAASKQLDVVYRVFYTGRLPLWLLRSKGIGQDLAGRAAASAAGARAFPVLSYDRARRLFPGVRGAFQLGGGLIDSASIDLNASTSSFASAAVLKGARQFANRLISEAEWQVAHSYSSYPSDSVRLNAGTLSVGAAASTRALQGRDLQFRFGGAVEGGNRQSDLPPAAVPSSAVRSSYGGVKSYIGSSYGFGRNVLKASYAMQFGSADGTSFDFLKTLVDVDFTRRFLPAPHKPVVADVRFTAGAFPRSDRVPVAERFYGGVSTTSFLPGDSWDIPSGPVIRSFPFNRLNRVGPGEPAGGTRFFSVNVTVAPTVWSLPAVPAEVLADDRLVSAIGSQLLSGRRTSVLANLAQTGRYADLKPELADAMTVVSAIDADLARLLQRDLDADLKSQIGDMRSDFSDLSSTLKQARDAGFNAMAQLRTAAVGFGNFGAAQMSDTAETLDGIITALPPSTPEAATLRKSLGNLAAAQKLLQTGYDHVQELRKYSSDQLRPLIGIAEGLKPSLAAAESTLSQIPSGSAGNAPVATVVDRVQRATQSIERIAAEPDESPAEFTLLAEGMGDLNPSLLSQVADLLGETAGSLKATRPDDARTLDGLAAKVRGARSDLLRGMKTLTVPAVDAAARRDIAYTARVLDAVFRELNIIGVAPVLALDAARLGPTAPGYGGLRYGVGGGVRLSIALFDVAAGYSVNPNRRPHEGRGAFWFTLDFSNLFR